VAEGTTRQLRVLHIVSSGGIAEAMQATLFMPLLTRLPKQRVKAQVIALAPGCVRAPVLRQNGVPVHEVALSRQRFSLGAFKELMSVVHTFRPDIVQAWGHTAQLTSIRVRAGCDWKPRVIWSVVETAPLPKNAGLIDRQKIKLVAKAAARADRIVYTSEAAAAHHRRAGYPDGGHECISPGVDPVRFKPDLAARNKVRQQLKLPPDAFVVGMVAPFQPEYDHATFLKAVGELIKTNPNLYVVLAGHGLQRGNAALMAMIGGGTLGTRTLLLGEVSDLSSLFNACDTVCLSALTDSARMTLAMAMLCGVPCVATGMGAQGELIGQHGVAVEPGSPQAFVRGITKIMQMPPERRMHLAQGARKHALQNLVSVRSLQRYLQLYAGLVGREALAVNAIAAPEVDASIPTAPPPKTAEPEPRKDAAAIVADMSDPDSLEAKVAPAQPEPLPKWRLEQEAARAKMEEQSSSARSDSDGDVLQLFEQELAKPVAHASPMQERARGVADDVEELLPLEALTAPAAAAATPASTASPTKEPVAAPKSDVSAQSASPAPVAAHPQPPAAPQPVATAPTPAASVTPAPVAAAASSGTSAAPEARPAAVAAASETVSAPQPAVVSAPAAASAAPQGEPAAAPAPTVESPTPSPQPAVVAAPSEAPVAPQPAAAATPIAADASAHPAVAAPVAQPSTASSASAALEPVVDNKNASETNRSAAPQADSVAEASQTGEHITATGEIKLLESEAPDSRQAQLDFGASEPHEPVQVSLFDVEPTLEVERTPEPEKKLMSG